MKRRIFLGIAVLFLCFCGLVSSVEAQESTSTGFLATQHGFKLDENGECYSQFLCEENAADRKMAYFFQVMNNDLQGREYVTFESSNPSVCSVEQEDARQVAIASASPRNTPHKFSFRVNIHKPGVAFIIAKVAGKAYKATIIALPKTPATIKSITVNNYRSILLQWNKVEAATGYIIVRVNGKETDDFTDWRPVETMAVVEGGDTLSKAIVAPRDEPYSYAVYPKIKVGNKEYYSVQDKVLMELDGTVHYQGYKRYTFYYTHKKDFLNVSASGSKMKLMWRTDPHVSAYEIYEKTVNEAAWKLIYKEKSKKIGNFTKGEKAGKSYEFRIVYVYPDGTRLESNSRSCYLPKSVKKIKRKIKIKQVEYWWGQGQYTGGCYSSPDEVFYYEENGKLHTVSYTKKKIIDYSLSETGKIRSKKQISLGKFDYFGGFYHAPDGNNYVVVGYANKKKSKTKTVIKVTKFSAKWKKQRECKIKGNSGNIHPGIVYPFDGGNCRMEWCDKNLYLFTCREMFNGHQSNISFRINPETMTYVMANEDFTGHSFNQYVRYDNHTLFLSNHGDAYSRGVNLTTVFNYLMKRQSKKEILPFKIKGKSGDNYTGLTEGGMEVTKNHVLISGMSVPQNYKVAGVSGASNKLARNVYILSCEKESGVSKIHWFTKYHPKKSKVEVSEVRLVKLSDDYVVLLYATKKKKSKSILHYVVLNEEGKAIYKTTYKNMKFTGSTQPILYNGAIVWTDVEGKKTTYFYHIPARIR